MDKYKPNSANYDLKNDDGKIKWNNDIDKYYKKNNLYYCIPIKSDNIFVKNKHHNKCSFF